MPISFQKRNALMSDDEVMQLLVKSFNKNDVGTKLQRLKNQIDRDDERSKDKEGD